VFLDDGLGYGYHFVSPSSSVSNVSNNAMTSSMHWP